MQNREIPFLARVKLIIFLKQDSIYLYSMRSVSKNETVCI